ncbi:hypothetical protein RHECNPAF_750066 [Rhizobium etli CNPAF512]|nr:hypothetical protein RHECNPAF_750066 [Rhizobium etli CNPAF512]
MQLRLPSPVGILDHSEIRQQHQRVTVPVESPENRIDAVTPAAPEHRDIALLAGDRPVQRIMALGGIQIRGQHVVVIIDVGVRFLRLHLRLTLVDPIKRLRIHVAADAGVDGVAEDFVVLQRCRILSGQDGELPMIRLALGEPHAGGGDATERLVERHRIVARRNRPGERRPIGLGERVGSDDAPRGQLDITHMDRVDRPSGEFGVTERHQLEIAACLADVPAGRRCGNRDMRGSSAKKKARRSHHPVPHRKAPQRSRTRRSGSSRLSLTRTRKVTASLPSTMR